MSATIARASRTRLLCGSANVRSLDPSELRRCNKFGLDFNAHMGALDEQFGEHGFDFVETCRTPDGGATFMPRTAR